MRDSGKVCGVVNYVVNHAEDARGLLNPKIKHMITTGDKAWLVKSYGD
jgi:hypothetical protein